MYCGLQQITSTEAKQVSRICQSTSDEESHKSNGKIFWKFCIN
jgi:hypothetical protein